MSIYNGILFSHKKENPATCENMDESWRHYAKWNKSDREVQIMCDLTYIQNLKKKLNPYKQMLHVGSSSLKRDRTQAPWIGSEVLATGPPGNSPNFQV